MVVGRRRQDEGVEEQEGSLGGRRGGVGFGCDGRGVCVVFRGQAFVCCLSQSRKGRERKSYWRGCGSLPASREEVLAGLQRAYRPTLAREGKKMLAGLQERTGQQRKRDIGGAAKSLPANQEKRKKKRCWRGCKERTGQQRKREGEREGRRDSWFDWKRLKFI